LTAPGSPESRLQSIVYTALAAVVAVGFYAVVMCYWVPANSWGDQHAYLVAGRLLAEQGTTKYAPRNPASGEVDPFRLIGNMWVTVDPLQPTERIYSKYPIGYPLLIAAAWKFGGVEAAYLVNPVASALAVFGAFLLMRRFMPSHLAVMGQLIFALSPMTLLLAIDPQSHATAVCCVTWGMLLLLHWWQTGWLWTGIIAGLLLGYAMTIRYTEGALLLPIALAIVFRREWRRGLVLVGCWTMPGIVLVIYNLCTIDTFTGYDLTGESEPGNAFAVGHFASHVERMFRQFSTFGLFFLFPAALIGLACMFAKRTREAMILAGWILPSLAVYTFYYYAPESMPVGYLRFFHTILPALVLCGVWLVAASTAGGHRVAPVIAGAVVTLISAAVRLPAVAGEMEKFQTAQLRVLQTCQPVLDHLPDDAVLYTRNRSQSLHLNVAKSYVLYDLNMFRRPTIEKLAGRVDGEDAAPLDPGRAKSAYERLKGLDQKALDRALAQSIRDNLNAGRRVFIWEGPIAIRSTPTPRTIASLPSSDPPITATFVASWRLAPGERSWVLFELSEAATPASP
jgi:hypothetical protein